MRPSREPDTLVIKPFSAGELRSFHILARDRPDFDTLAGAVQRLQVLRTFASMPPDPTMDLGASDAEAAALAALALIPSPSRRAWRVKADLFASAEPGRDDNLAAMLAASLARDAERLGLISRASAARFTAAVRIRSAERTP